MGKSAQIPLFPWLADAMEGPTPVSALIHAATMVTAGVYLLCRVNPLLHASPSAELTIAIVGAATAFVAATIACAQQDIKKVLAYSTVSQLGYMFLAIGCGAYTAAIFLMVAHAFFKGLLFLGAGSVIHGLHDEQDLKRMGNLRAYLPITFITFGIGWLCIAAVPPFSGFWAKGDVLDNTWAAHPALWVVGIVTAALTAYYMSRLTGLAFFGKDRWAGDGHRPRARRRPRPPRRRGRLRAPRVAVDHDGAAVDPGVLRRRGRGDGHLGQPVLAGQLGGPGVRQQPLPRTTCRRRPNGSSPSSTPWSPSSSSSIGLRLWSTRADRPALEGAFLRGAWYINELYDTVFGRPSERLAAFCADVVDPKIIDGAVNGVAGAFRGSGSLLRRTQTGFVRNYLVGIMFGAVVILGFMLTRMWWG